MIQCSGVEVDAIDNCVGGIVAVRGKRNEISKIYQAHCS